MVRRKNAVHRLLPLLLLLVAAPRGWAGENEFEVGTFLSHYMWRGLRLSEGPVYQTSCTLGTKGFSFNAWGNYDFRAKTLNEIDLTVSYGRETKRADFETGLIHYAMIGSHDNDELYASVTGKGPFSPSLTAYFDVNMGKGAFLQASAGPSLKLSPKASLDLRVSAGIVVHDGFMGIPDSGREFSGFHNIEFLAALPIELNDHWSVRMQAGVTTPLSHNAREAICNASIWKPSQSNFPSTFLYGGLTFFYSF